MSEEQQNTILSIVIDKINKYVKHIMGVIISTNYHVNELNQLTINYIGGFVINDNNYISQYFRSKVDGIIFLIDGNYIKIVLVNGIKEGNKLQLIMNLIYINDYLFYPDLITIDLLGEIVSNLNNKQDIINFCKSLSTAICDKSELIGFLIYKNYPELAKEIRKLEQIDRANYSQDYKDLYFLILDRGLPILTSTDNIFTGNELIYRLIFYFNYPGAYPKINQYISNNLFIEIMKMYTFPYLGTNNIYSIYALTGILDTDNCENKENYMNTDDITIVNVELITECIQITDSKLYKFQKAIIPWIGINDILTFFMIMDIKREISSVHYQNTINEHFEDVNLLKKLLVMKYRSSKYFDRLLNVFETA